MHVGIGSCECTSDSEAEKSHGKNTYLKREVRFHDRLADLPVLRLPVRGLFKETVLVASKV